MPWASYHFRFSMRYGLILFDSWGCSPGTNCWVTRVSATEVYSSRVLVQQKNIGPRLDADVKFCSIVFRTRHITMHQHTIVKRFAIKLEPEKSEHRFLAKPEKLHCHYLETGKFIWGLFLDVYAEDTHVPMYFFSSFFSTQKMLSKTTNKIFQNT